MKKERSGRPFLREFVVDNQEESWYTDSPVIKMIFICDKCHFIFSRAIEPEQCPDCGKYAVRPANEAEQREYEKRLNEPQEW